MQPSVHLLLRSFEKVNLTVDTIEKIEHARAGVEREKWRTHQEEMKMMSERFESALEYCLKSEDLKAERARVDGKVAALKLDLEALSADQLRSLRMLMGNEVVSHKRARRSRRALHPPTAPCRWKRRRREEKREKSAPLLVTATPGALRHEAHILTFRP
jgi:hypothetical protein